MSGPARVWLPVAAADYYGTRPDLTGGYPYTPIEYYRADLHEAVVRERDEARRDLAAMREQRREWHKAAIDLRCKVDLMASRLLDGTWTYGIELMQERNELRRALDEAPHARDAARYAAWRDYMLSNDERDELDLPDAVWMAGDSEEFDDAVDQWRAERENMKSRIPRAGGSDGA